MPRILFSLPLLSILLWLFLHLFGLFCFPCEVCQAVRLGQQWDVLLRGWAELPSASGALGASLLHRSLGWALCSPPSCPSSLIWLPPSFPIDVSHFQRVLCCFYLIVFLAPSKPSVPLSTFRSFVSLFSSTSVGVSGAFETLCALPVSIPWDGC